MMLCVKFEARLYISVLRNRVTLYKKLWLETEKVPKSRIFLNPASLALFNEVAPRVICTGTFQFPRYPELIEKIKVMKMVSMDFID
jgi:hypothetical protein